jgi:hypothetical protein
MLAETGFGLAADALTARRTESVAFPVAALAPDRVGDRGDYDRDIDHCD